MRFTRTDDWLIRSDELATSGILNPMHPLHSTSLLSQLLRTLAGDSCPSCSTSPSRTGDGLSPSSTTASYSNFQNVTSKWEQLELFDAFKDASTKSGETSTCPQPSKLDPTGGSCPNSIWVIFDRHWKVLDVVAKWPLEALEAYSAAKYAVRFYKGERVR